MKTKKRRILLRADGSKKTGIGHLVRSLTLAATLNDADFDVVLAGKNARKAQVLDPSFSNVRVIEIEFPSLGLETNFIDSHQPDLVIADGYGFTKDFFQSLKQRGIPFGIIDDNFETKADKPLFLLNQNPIAKREMYPQNWSQTTFLLGLDFALIRQAILERSNEPDFSQSGEVLLTVGGTDSLGVAPLLAQSLHRLGLSTAVPENQVSNDKKSSSPTSTGKQQTIVFSPANYPTYLATAKFAVLGGGSSLYEALALAIPTIAIVVADNQIASAQVLSDHGLLVGFVDMRKSRSQALLEFERMVKLLVSEGPRGLSTGPDLSAGKIRVVDSISRLIPEKT